jgi:hypothetical protein
VITGFTDSDIFTTGATLNGTTIEFNRNDLINAYSVDLSSINTDNYTTGGTYNSLTESIDFNGNSSATTFSVDVSQLLDDTNTYTTGATLNGNIVEFNRNDLTNAYSVDLTNLNLPINYSNVVFVDVINGNDFTATINNFNRPCTTISQGINIAITLPGLSSDNRALVYIRRGNYVNPVLFLQNNVDVYCEPGVVFTNIVQIRDNGVAVNSNIYGKLKINSGGSTVPFRITGESTILFEFDSIIANAAAIEVVILNSNNNITINRFILFS